MSYKAGIVKAIQELKDRNGSSSIAIKKHMQAHLPKDKKWMNATFLASLKSGVTSGEFVQHKNSYKLSADFKKKSAKVGKPKAATKSASKPSAAPKKKKSAVKAKTAKAETTTKKGKNVKKSATPKSTKVKKTTTKKTAKKPTKATKAKKATESKATK